MKLSLSLRLKLLEAFMFASLTLVNGNFTTFLNLMGYSDTVIGILFAAAGAVTMVCEPLLGSLCDRHSPFRVLMICCTGAAAGTMFLFFRFAGVFTMSLVYAVTVGLMVCTMGLLDNWVMRLAQENSGIDYGRTRAVGSLSFAAATYLFGQLLARIGYENARWLLLGAATLTVLTALMVPDPRRESAAEPVSLHEALVYLAHNREYKVFVFCLLLAMLSGQSFQSYLPVLLERVGGGIGYVGTANALAAATEIVVMAAMTPLVKKFGTRRVLCVGFFGHALKSVVSVLMPTPAAVAAASLLQIFSFAITIPASVLYQFEHVEPRYTGVATMLSMSLTYSLAQFFGFAYGALSDALGVVSMLLLMSLCAVAGGVVFLLETRRTSKSAPQN